MNEKNRNEKSMREKSTDASRHPVPDLSQDYDYTKASSVTDCTGAVPTPPQTSAELDSYLKVYDFLPHSALTQPNDVEVDMLAAQKKKKK